jgi:hypothetical protein
MKLSKLDRRDFVEAMLLLGLTACGGGRLGQRAMKSSPSTEGGLGRFYDSMARLSNQLVRGSLSGREYVQQAGDRLLELELEEDVLADWTRSGPDEGGVGKNGYRTIHTRHLRFAGRPGRMRAILFYTPPGTANPPHEHHNLVSCKRVLKGSYHVRQYERLRRVEPGVIAIRQVSELLDVGFRGPYVDMADDWRNVHWFGTAAGTEPVLALNVVVDNALPPAGTFHGAGETRAAGQYYIDPTAAPDAQGIILAPSVTVERAAELAGRPMTDFPSRLTAALHRR